MKAPALREGDVIGLASPSAPHASLLPHRVAKAREALAALGLGTRIAPNALRSTGYTAGTPRERAEDLHELFRDDQIRGIMGFIGGNHSNQLLGRLDFDLIREHPKVFVGYSDMTVLHLAIRARTKLVTFYGPTALTQFGEHPAVLDYTKRSLWKAASQPGMPIGPVHPSDAWTDEILDWFEKKDLERPRRLHPNAGYEWLRPGSAEGEITGGCLPSLMHLRGTPYWPEMDGKIFFWELPPGSGGHAAAMELADVDALLTDLDLSGVYGKISGMIVGRPFGFDPERFAGLKELIMERTKEYTFPVLLNADIGHTDPMATIPMGVMARIDALSSDPFVILESGVTE
jgi:muramoyltetrapeptide carboxypeptidase